ncbi:MAG TPA: hypothetical protein VEB67_02065 [Nitrososphaerales archaeon]|nr:hypothetical protein [Nitrososphaerales archaeon]
MADGALESLRRQLDAETQSEKLGPLPIDFYSKLSAYSQGLRRASATGGSEVTQRLASAQAKLIDGMVRTLLEVRMAKATKQADFVHLLPEERYVSHAQETYARRFADFVQAVSEDSPSFIEFAHRKESQRSVKVRFVRPVAEMVGLDMKRYGPYQPEDVASIPASSADILISSGDAVEIRVREEG